MDISIDKQALINALLAHVLAKKGTMTPGQVSAALALLKFADDKNAGVKNAPRHEDFLEDLT